MEAKTSTILQLINPTLHPFAGKKVPLTVFDHAAMDIFVPSVRAYSAPTPSNDVLKEGLLRAVALYPHLAGRLVVDDQGRQFLHVNNDGVLVVEAIVPANLDDVLADGMTANIDELYPPIPEENFGAALLQVKLNRYKCGGLVIGTIAHHHVADGQSFCMFFTMWASATRDGRDFTILSPPFLDRAATAVPRATPKPIFDHRSIEFKKEGDRDHNSISHAVVPMDKIKSLKVNFTPEFIADLKERVGVRCSTFQCLLAHVWKKVTVVRDLRPEEFTQVRVAVNCRSRANPPVPMDFFGNMVLWAFPKLQAGDLLNSSYGRVVGVIRDAVSRIDGEYIQSFVDFGAVADMNGEHLAATAAEVGTMMCPDLEVDSWLGFQFHQMDLGTGPPCAFLTPNVPIEGLMVFVPSRTAEGGVDLFVGVAGDQVDLFQQICHSMGCPTDGAQLASARM